MRKPSTRSLADLPSIDELMRQSKAMAMLDAILSPEWEFRYYSFNAKWGPGEAMASMRDGAGNDYFILFNEHGAAMKGFDHEAEMSPWAADPPAPWPGVYDSVPEEFSSFLNEPAFSMEAVTFCIWRRWSDSAWQCGVDTFPDDDGDPDGSAWMLAIFDGDPRTYQTFAGEYYEVEVPLEAVQAIYDHKPLTTELIRALSREATAESVEAEAREIGYP